MRTHNSACKEQFKEGFLVDFEPCFTHLEIDEKCSKRDQYTVPNKVRGVDRNKGAEDASKAPN